MDFSIGADPEVFVGDALMARSIIGKIGGTKQHPQPLPLGKGFAVQEDNVALEFNIPASKNKAAFVKNITAATGFLEQLVKDRLGYHFLKQSAISFPEEELQDPMAFVFGCDPDYNIWTNSINPRPHATDPFLRSAGGHVHIGHKEAPLDTIKFCDLYMGVPSILMDKLGAERRVLYGKAGAYRKKSFGMEYRTLSNFWIFDDRLVSWVYDNTERALVAATSGVSIDEDKEAILEAINNCNSDAINYLVSKHNLEVLHD